MSHVKSVCTPCCMLLRVVGSCCAKMETGQTLSQQLPTFLLFSDRRRVAQQCWIQLHSSSNIVGAREVLYTRSPWSSPSFMGCVLPTMQRRSQHCWNLLHPFAHHYQNGRNNFQHGWPVTHDHGLLRGSLINGFSICPARNDIYW